MRAMGMAWYAGRSVGSSACRGCLNKRASKCRVIRRRWCNKSQGQNDRIKAAGAEERDIPIEHVVILQDPR
jgi:hypothetical protein